MPLEVTFNDAVAQANDSYKAFKRGMLTGKNPVSGKRITMADAGSVSNAPVLLPRVITEIARDAIEPNLVLTRLLDRVNWEPGLQIVFGATGAIEAGEVAEGMEYPEVSVQMGGASAVATVGKWGVAFKYTDEMERAAQIDIYNLYIRKCGEALARLKEKMVADHLVALGTTVYDNANPTSSLLGTTKGRDQDGNANGSITFDDLFDMFGIVIMKGFLPNLMLLHPLTWIMFMKDPILRSFALAAGGGTWWGQFQGNPAGRAPWGLPREQGTTGQNVVPSNVQGLAPSELREMQQVPTLTSAPVPPSYFLPWSFAIVVSPFMYYDPTTKLTDIIIADSRELGALVVASDVEIEQWRDFPRDMWKVKLREEYSIFVYNDGNAVAVAKNVSVEPNAIIFPAQSQIDAGSLPAISGTVPVV